MLKLTNICTVLIAFLATADSAIPVPLPVLCSIDRFSSKPDLGLSGSIIVSPRSKGGIYITGFLQNAPVSTTGIIFIGTDTDCNTDCAHVHEDLCLGGRETGGKQLWNKMTYTSDSFGAAFIAITQPNMEFSDTLNHCLVVQAADESRIGCGELKVAK